MSLLKIDDTSGDLAVVNNQWVLIPGGGNQVLQAVRSRLRAIRGEWFLDPTVGPDYFGIIWVKGMPETIRSAELKRQIMTVPGVLDLQAFSAVLDTATRLYTVSFSALSTDGTPIASTEVLT